MHLKMLIIGLLSMFLSQLQVRLKKHLALIRHQQNLQHLANFVLKDFSKVLQKFQEILQKFARKFGTVLKKDGINSAKKHWRLVLLLKTVQQDCGMDCRNPGEMRKTKHFPLLLQ